MRQKEIDDEGGEEDHGDDEDEGEYTIVTHTDDAATTVEPSLPASEAPRTEVPLVDGYLNHDGHPTSEAHLGSTRAPKKICIRLGQNYTHNEQILVCPCGIILARETFYGTEALSASVVCLVCLKLLVLIFSHRNSSKRRFIQPDIPTTSFLTPTASSPSMLQKSRTLCSKTSA